MSRWTRVIVVVLFWSVVRPAHANASGSDEGEPAGHRQVVRVKPKGLFWHLRAWVLEELDAVPRESIAEPTDETADGPTSAPPKRETAGVPTPASPNGGTAEVPPSAPAGDGTAKEPKPKPAKTESAKLGLPKLSGYVQMFYRHAFDSNNDGTVDSPNFRVQRVRINVKGKIFPWASYDIEVDPRAPEVAGILRDAFLSLKFIPHHELRLGQQKTQFGYENSESSTRLYTVNRAELSDNLSRGVNLRDLGVGLIGKWPLGGGFRFEDAITVVNGAGLNVQNDNNNRKNIFGRIGLRYKKADLMARLGVSGAVGDILDTGNDLADPKDDFLVKFDRIGTDLEIDHSRGFMNFEYVMGRDDIQARRFPERLPAEHVDRKGYYITLGGKTPWKVGPLIRYDTLDNNLRRWTLGAYYGLPSDRLRFLVNYELRSERDGVRADDKLYFWTQFRF